MNLYALYDTKAECFLPILEAQNDDHAQRIIADAVAKNEPLWRHASDYTLFKISEYDNLTGYVTQDARPERVVSLVTIIENFYQPPSAEDKPEPPARVPTTGEDLEPPRDEVA